MRSRRNEQSVPELVNVNGIISPIGGAGISDCDRGLLYGEALFETMRARNGEIFKIERHLARLTSSAHALGFSGVPDAEKLEGELIRSLRKSGLTEAYIRLTLTGGAGMGLTVEPATAPNFIIHVRPLRLYPERLYREGVRMIISKYRRDELSPLVRHKTTGYLISILAKREAAAADCDDALLLNTRGEAAETTVSNIFSVKNGCVLTPSIESGALPGITRALILELCRENGIECEESALPLVEFRQADEIFMTNTLMGVMPVALIAGSPVGGAVPGPLTDRLSGLYRAL